MADAADTKAKGPSIVVQIGLLAGMTVAALGVGWLAGSYLKNSLVPPPPPKMKHDAPQPDAASSAEAGAGTTLVELPAITTNLAAPTETWVRMDASVVYDAPQPAETTQAIHQDILAFLRTLRMHQVEGASGFQHLKADLKERAAIRSDGHARDVLIRTLLFE
ncbi:flagellar basal body-associated FliL family protein [Mesorhizobium sp. SP-1A]|uniref:flagellar basal body-associated FliL family protein n=1 Tax=Mesorhizobium sp. SP-1A TaxID=3077840 RepID=UPI0028F7432E|nr:flagellar basal body-associated FliL family protein [Mesorhizobium sp. SP-1A]